MSALEIRALVIAMYFFCTFESEVHGCRVSGLWLGFRGWGGAGFRVWGLGFKGARSREAACLTRFRVLGFWGFTA